MLLTGGLMTGCSGLSPDSLALPQPDGPGALAWQRRCANCHALPHPRRLDYPGWQALLPVMEQHMHARGLPALSENERHNILRWLAEHSR